MGIKTVPQPPYSQTLLPVTFGYSLSSVAVVMRQLKRWKRLWGRSLTRSYKRTSMGPSRSCWNGTTKKHTISGQSKIVFRQFWDSNIKKKNKKKTTTLAIWTCSTQYFLVNLTCYTIHIGLPNTVSFLLQFLLGMTAQAIREQTGVNDIAIIEDFKFKNITIHLIGGIINKCLS